MPSRSAVEFAAVVLSYCKRHLANEGVVECVVICEISLYPISGEEWEFWISDVATAKAPAIMVETARRNLGPLKERISLIEGEVEIVPGVRAIATFGHTPGHIALSIASDSERLLHISDAVLYPLHLEHPEWTPVSTYSPSKLLPASGASSISRQKKMLWSSHTIFLPTRVWGAYASESKDGAGNPRIHKPA